MINEKLQKKVERIIAGMEGHSFVEIVDELLSLKDADGTRIFSIELHTSRGPTASTYWITVHRSYLCNCTIKTEYCGADLPFTLWKAVTANINKMYVQKEHLKEKK